MPYYPDHSLPPAYSFRRLHKADLPVLALHAHLVGSSFNRSWMMAVNSQPAFCISLTPGFTHDGEGSGRCFEGRGVTAASGTDGAGSAGREIRAWNDKKYRENTGV